MVSVIDTDNDGKIGKRDVETNSALLELQLREEKADSQRRMAWTAIVSMIVFTILLFSPMISDSRVSALADLLGLFYIAQAGVVGAYMGVTAWMSKSSSPTITRITDVTATPSKKVPQPTQPEL
jgi:hypothetical protein